jgi:glycosyltransferase involved in cell wall biosynthesis
VVALVESPDHVCCRYRLAAFRPMLETAGHTLELTPLPRGWVRTLRLFAALRDADAVILQRRLLPAFQLAVLRRFARKLIFDFDDAVWLRDSYHPRGLASRRRSGRFRGVVRAADLVVAGNAFLAAEAERDARSPVVVIPTCLDPMAYPVADHTAASGLRLAWVGSASTLRGLECVRESLEAVGRAVPGVHLKMICDQFLRFDALPVDEVPWARDTEAAELAAADIGIAWMPDDDWSRGKCGLKVLQYQAAGMPVIANPVGVHNEMVRPGENGYLVRTPGEWVEAVSRLAADAGRRRRMGAAGRSRVEAAYGVATGGGLWIDALTRLDTERGMRTAG